MNTNTQSPAVATHTPDPRLTPVPAGPFRVAETQEFPAGWSTAVRGTDGKRLCTIVERDYVPKESGNVRAAFIVRACNSHAQLVAALEFVRKWDAMHPEENRLPAQLRQTVSAALQAAKE